MQFDWYAATIDDDHDAVIKALVARCDGTVKYRAGIQGYKHKVDIRDNDDVVASVLFGGANGQPHARATGKSAPWFSRVVRSYWRESHVVSRIDSAIDYEDEGAWERLTKSALEVATQRSLRVSQAGDFFRCEAGRTYYIGSMKSAVFVRIYEKGKQERGRALDASLRDSINPNWVRAEVQVRPEDKGRKRARYVSPEEVWGFSRMSAAILERIEGLKVPHLEQRAKQQTTDERAFDQLCKQYGNVLTRTVDRLGSWSALGERIGSRINAVSEPKAES